MNFHDPLDTLFSYFSNEEHSQMMSQGKSAFVDFAAPFDEENSEIELKWSQFRDWFLFSYSEGNPSPLDIISDSEFYQKVSIDKDILEAIVNSEHGLFRFLRPSKNQVKVRNLITKTKTYVFDENIPLSLDRDDYFQTRIFKYKEEFYFGASLVVHPPLARRFLDKKAKEICSVKDEGRKKVASQNFFDEIFKMYYKVLRFKQLEVGKIYSETPFCFVNKRTDATL